MCTWVADLDRVDADVVTAGRHRSVNDRAQQVVREVGHLDLQPMPGSAVRTWCSIPRAARSLAAGWALALCCASAAAHLQRLSEGVASDVAGLGDVAPSVLRLERDRQGRDIVLAHPRQRADLGDHRLGGLKRGAAQRASQLQHVAKTGLFWQQSAQAARACRPRAAAAADQCGFLPRGGGGGLGCGDGEEDLAHVRLRRGAALHEQRASSGWRWQQAPHSGAPSLSASPSGCALTLPATDKVPLPLHVWALAAAQRPASKASARSRDMTRVLPTNWWATKSEPRAGIKSLSCCQDALPS